MRFSIIGNSGSGKSTLARWLARNAPLTVLDLDTVAWLPGGQPTRRPIEAAGADVERFCSQHERWAVEGCYEDLVARTFPFGPVLVFLDPGPERCAAHCRDRPWEPHKYASKADQDQNLDFLVSWVEEYYVRSGPMSHTEHLRLFDVYDGPKARFDVELDFAGPEPALTRLLSLTRSPAP